jgi:hypothetical protein
VSDVAVTRRPLRGGDFVRVAFHDLSGVDQLTHADHEFVEAVKSEPCAAGDGT